MAIQFVPNNIRAPAKSSRAILAGTDGETFGSSLQALQREQSAPVINHFTISEAVPELSPYKNRLSWSETNEVSGFSVVLKHVQTYEITLVKKWLGPREFVMRRGSTIVQ